MYRIQAHNVETKRIEVFKAYTHDEKMKLYQRLHSSPQYGLIEVEYFASGYAGAY